MSLRKLRHVNRGLLWIVGTPDSGAPCMDCRDHLARIQIMRRAKRDGSAYAVESKPLLHLCETCAMELVEGIVGMLGNMTRNRVDAELTHTTAQHAQIAKGTGQAARHDRRVRARIKKLKRDDRNLPTARRA
jgi:hypothetical protein